MVSSMCGMSMCALPDLSLTHLRENVDRNWLWNIFEKVLYLLSDDPGSGIQSFMPCVVGKGVADVGEAHTTNVDPSWRLLQSVV